MLDKTHIKFDDDGDSEDELYEDLPQTKKDKMEVEDEKEKDEEDEEEKVERDSVATDSNVSDLDYLKSKMQKGKSLDVFNESEEEEDESSEDDEENSKELENGKQSSEGEESEDEDEEDEKDEKDEEDESDGEMEEEAEETKEKLEGEEKTKEENKTEDSKVEEKDSLKDEDEDEDVGVTGRLFVRNLPFSVSEDELSELFEAFGPVSEVHIPMNLETRQGKGIAFILFVVPLNAVKAMEELDGSIFQGRLLHVLPGKSPKLQTSKEPKTFQEKKEAKMQEMKHSSHNWNSLFMRSDAIADAIAARQNIQKADLFDREKDNAAVRLALAETTILNETKKMLEEVLVH